MVPTMGRLSGMGSMKLVGLAILSRATGCSTLKPLMVLMPSFLRLDLPTSPSARKLKSFGDTEFLTVAVADTLVVIIILLDIVFFKIEKFFGTGMTLAVRSFVLYKFRANFILYCHDSLDPFSLMQLGFTPAWSCW